MDEQIARLLADTQRPEHVPRQQAELELKRNQTNPEYPIALAKIAAHGSIETNIRQSALSTLRLFIQNNWATEDLEELPIPISDESRAILRQTLLDVALNPEDDRKVKIAAR